MNCTMVPVHKLYHGIGAYMKIRRIYLLNTVRWYVLVGQVGLWLGLVLGLGLGSLVHRITKTKLMLIQMLTLILTNLTHPTTPGQSWVCSNLGPPLRGLPNRHPDLGPPFGGLLSLPQKEAKTWQITAVLSWSTESFPTISLQCWAQFR